MQSRQRQHGTHSCYSHGCRRNECREAHRTYTRNRLRVVRRAAQGIGELPESPYVDVSSARRHLKYLSTKGIGTNIVARETGIARSTLVAIKNNEAKKFCTKAVENAILSIVADKVDANHFVDARYVKHLVSEIRSAGYTIPQINSMLGNKTLHQKLVTGKYVRYWKQKKIEALHFALLRKLPSIEKPKPELQKRVKQ